MRKARVAGLDVVLGGGTDRLGGGDGPLLVLLHGYGAPGDDLVPLARQIEAPRSVRYAFPAAPIQLDPGAPADASGRAWWPIDMLELQRAVLSGDLAALTGRVPTGLTEARAQVEALLDELVREHGVKREQLVLGGFSQGAMLATDVTLRSPTPPAALVILSGSLIAQGEWLPLMPARSGLPVLQSHGRADPVLSYEIAEELRRALTAAGLPVDFHAFNGGHGIPNGVVSALGALLTRIATA
jgi:phospholipase/carboxylesterase